MATNILFHRVVQDSQTFGSTETKAVSRVHFDLEVDGEMYRDLHVDLEELVGGNHSDEKIAVGKLVGVPISVNPKAFQEAVRRYYQSLVRSAGFGKHLAKDKGFRTFGDELGMEQVIELQP